MAYVTSDGRVLQSRPWSFQAIIDMFWAFINVVVLFFRTLMPGDSKKGDNATTDYRRPGRPGGGPGHGPNVRGFRRGGAPSSSPPMAAGG